MAFCVLIESIQAQEHPSAGEFNINDAPGNLLLLKVIKRSVFYDSIAVSFFKLQRKVNMRKGPDSHIDWMIIHPFLLVH